LRFLFKPSDGMQGKGILEARGRAQVLEMLAYIEKNRTQMLEAREKYDAERASRSASRSAHRRRAKPIPTFIAQRFIEPFLFKGRFMFSIRVYVVLFSIRPLRAMYHPGHAKIAMEDYRNPQPGFEKFAWTTNHALQLLHPNYTRESHAPRTSLLGGLDPATKGLKVKLRRTALHATKALAGLTEKQGWQPSPEHLLFTLLSYDLLVDRDLQPWFLEANKDSGSISCPERVRDDLNQAAPAIAARALLRKVAGAPSECTFIASDLQGQAAVAAQRGYPGEWEALFSL